MGLRTSMILGTLQSVQNAFQSCMSEEQGPRAFTCWLLSSWWQLLVGVPPTHTLSPLTFGAVGKYRSMRLFDPGERSGQTAGCAQGVCCQDPESQTFHPTLPFICY